MGRNNRSKWSNKIRQGRSISKEGDCSGIRNTGQTTEAARKLEGQQARHQLRQKKQHEAQTAAAKKPRHAKNGGSGKNSSKNTRWQAATTGAGRHRMGSETRQGDANNDGRTDSRNAAKTDNDEKTTEKPRSATRKPPNPDRL